MSEEEAETALEVPVPPPQPEKSFTMNSTPMPPNDPPPPPSPPVEEVAESSDEPQEPKDAPVEADTHQEDSLHKANEEEIQESPQTDESVIPEKPSSQTEQEEQEEQEANDTFSATDTPTVDPTSKEPYAPATNKIRHESHTRLRAYESKRRAAYTSKLSSSTIYWRSFRELLSFSLRETERAESLFRGNVVAHMHYGEYCRAVVEDRLDYEGHAITGKKAKKVQEERKARYTKLTQGSIGSANAGGSAGANAASSREKGGKFTSAPSIESISEMRRTNLVKGLVDSQSVMADRFVENANYVKNEILVKVEKLRMDLESEVFLLEKLGDGLILELEAAEDEVQEAWAAYYAMAQRSLNTSMKKPTSPTINASSSDQPLPSDAIGLPEIHTDVWLVEMHYRMSVAFLSTCWDKCSIELSKLFASMKEAECHRRTSLRELILNFVQHQERLWLSIQPVLTPVLKDIIDRPVDRSTIETDVQNAIRQRAEGIQLEEAAAKKVKDIQSDTGPGLTNIKDHNGNIDLTSPLVSDLLCKANVIEKKGSGYMSGWKPTLAMATADGFLHFFDIPSSVKVTNGSAAEVAFHALIPTVQVPTVQSVKANKSNTSKPWHEYLNPSDSLVLPNCAISFKDEGTNSEFEITEMILNSGASKVFGKKTSTRKFFLRTVNRKETVEWLSTLQGSV